MIRKIFFAVAFIATAFFGFGSAKATTYRCNTKQVITWMHGNLSPDKSPNARPDSILQFDDETGYLWAAFDRHTYFNSTLMKIVQKRDVDANGIGMVTAVLNDIIREPTGEDHWITTDVFRIIRSKKTGINFLHYIATENRLATGKCHVIDKIIDPNLGR